METTKQYQPTSTIAPDQPSAPVDHDKVELKQIGTRITAANFRRLKTMAAMRDTTIQSLIEQAVSDLLVAHES